MSMFKRTLCAASAAIVLGLTATAAQAQTATAYAYSISLALGSPAGTSGAATAAKNRPAGIKVLPCLSGTVSPIDAMTFTLKYDAGKLLPATNEDAVQSDTRKDVYVIFQKEGFVTPYIQLYRDPAATTFGGQQQVQVRTNTLLGGASAVDGTPAGSSYLNSYASGGAIDSGREARYYAKEKVASGAQTEIIFGGQLDLTGLETGVWLATAIIGDMATIDFDNPTTWAAWDTVPFILNKPWKGAVSGTASCS